jgi:SAM-dependent methyltransferase
LVVGIDCSSSVEQAVERARKHKNIEVIQANILKPPVKKAFDLAVSLGVMHHLSDPAQGLRTGLEVLKPRGLLVIWTYSKEGNELYLRLVKPLRKIGPLLPHSVLLGFSLILAAPVYLHARVFNPFFKRLKLKLPLVEYICLVRKLRFMDLVNVVYDQIAPGLAFYPSRSEVEQWVDTAGGRIVELTMRTNNSWRAHIKPKQDRENQV